MVDQKAEFNQLDISDTNGPVDTTDISGTTRLNVIDIGDPTGTPGSPVISPKTRYNKDVGITVPLLLTGTYQTAYTRSGSGKLYSYVLDFDKSNAQIKLTIDGTNVIYECTVEEVQSFQAQDARRGAGPLGLGWDNTGNIHVWEPTWPVPYETSVLIEVRETAGPAINLDGALVILSEET